MSSAVALLVCVALLLLNGLFVASEFAVVGASRASVERLAQAGSRLARWAGRLLNTPSLQDRYIATSQIGITFASLGLGMVGEHGLADWLGPQLAALGVGQVVNPHVVASVLAVGGLTYFHIVLGEMVPKTVALARAERVLMALIPLMLVCFVITAPLVMILQGLGALVLRLLGIRREVESSQHYHSAEELELVVAESAASGLMEGTSGKMLREIFDFGDLTAGEVMVPRTQIVALALGATPAAMRETLEQTPFTRYPVYKGDLDHIIGVVSAKRLLTPLLAGAPLPREDLLSIPFVPATATLSTVLEVVSEHGSQMAVVMDEFGGAAGLVTTDDLSAEIVGAIAAGKADTVEIREESPGQLLVLGTARLEDLSEKLDSAIEHDDVDTVSGLVLMLLERPPRVGDAVNYCGLTISVVEVLGRGVGACIITLPEAGSGDRR